VIWVFCIILANAANGPLIRISGFVFVMGPQHAGFEVHTATLSRGRISCMLLKVSNVSEEPLASVVRLE
jgi:hypothetical protein